MFGLGSTEVLLIGIAALIVIGPKDLPGLFRTMGQMTGKARGMAREFSRAMEAAADEAGVKDVSSALKAATNPTKFGTDKLKEATGMKTTGMTKGPATQAMSEERKAAKEKLNDAFAETATDRKADDADTADKGDT